jgi:hypothetical protein
MAFKNARSATGQTSSAIQKPSTQPGGVSLPPRIC